MNTKIKITLLVLSMISAWDMNAQWTNQSITKLPYVNASCVVSKQFCFAHSGCCQTLANGIYTFTLKYNNQIQNGTFTISR